MSGSVTRRTRVFLVRSGGLRLGRGRLGLLMLLLFGVAEVELDAGEVGILGDATDVPPLLLFVVTLQLEGAGREDPDRVPVGADEAVELVVLGYGAIVHLQLAFVVVEYEHVIVWVSLVKLVEGLVDPFRLFFGIVLEESENPVDDLVHNDARDVPENAALPGSIQLVFAAQCWQWREGCRWSSLCHTALCQEHQRCQYV
ncbi:hypothetical protein PG990_003170 [Apiospora arundinis]